MDIIITVIAFFFPSFFFNSSFLQNKTDTMGCVCVSVAHLKFGSWEGGGVQPLPLVLRGQFLLNYNNFVLSENTVSEHMAIFKKNICKFFKYL